LYVSGEVEIEDGIYAHPTVTVMGRVELGRDVNLWPGAVIRGDLEPVRIGRRTNVQDNVVIHTSPGYEVEIAKDVSIGHGAVIHGATIETDVLIGMNATVMNGVVIEECSVVAAGAVVTEGTEVKSYEVWAGVPAKRIGYLTEDRVEKLIREPTRRYLKLAKKSLPRVEVNP